MCSMYYGVRNTVHIYKKQGLKINNIYIDGNFEELKNNINGIQIDLKKTSNDEYFLTVESYIITTR